MLLYTLSANARRDCGSARTSAGEAPTVTFLLVFSVGPDVRG